MKGRFREGEHPRPCFFFLRTGCCKFGDNCRYFHPGLDDSGMTSPRLGKHDGSRGGAGASSGSLRASSSHDQHQGRGRAFVGEERVDRRNRCRSSSPSDSNKGTDFNIDRYHPYTRPSAPVSRHKAAASSPKSGKGPGLSSAAAAAAATPEPRGFPRGPYSSSDRRRHTPRSSSRDDTPGRASGRDGRGGGCSPAVGNRQARSPTPPSPAPQRQHQQQQSPRIGGNSAGRRAGMRAGVRDSSSPFRPAPPRWSGAGQARGGAGGSALRGAFGRPGAGGRVPALRSPERVDESEPDPAYAGGPGRSPLLQDNIMDTMTPEQQAAWELQQQQQQHPALTRARFICAQLGSTAVTRILAPNAEQLALPAIRHGLLFRASQFADCVEDDVLLLLGEQPALAQA